MKWSFLDGRVASTIRGLVAIPLAWWGISRLLRPVFHVVFGPHPHGPGTLHLILPGLAAEGDVRMIVDTAIAVSLLLLTERRGWSRRRLLERSNLVLASGSLQMGVLGAAIGLLAGLIVMGVLAAAGCAHISYDPVSPIVLLSSMMMWAGIFLLVGFAEEFANRGYALRSLTEGIGFWPAALLTAAWFASTHLQEGDPWFGALSTGVFGVFMACTWRVTGSLGFAIGFHAAWDYTQSLVFGVPDSSFTMAGSLFLTHLVGPVWLSGGSVGPEGSIFTYLEFAILIGITVRIANRQIEPFAAGETGLALGVYSE